MDNFIAASSTWIRKWRNSHSQTGGSPQLQDFARVAALCCLAPLGAHADCKPVIAAYTAADATKRFALFEVDSLAQAPKGEPFMVTLGDARYTENQVRKGSFQIVKDGYKKGPFTPGFEANSVRDDEKKGKLRCEPLADRKVGNETWTGYQIRNNDKGSEPDPYATHLWVNRATGLPAWHGQGSDDGGYRWVYGAQVVAPTADKIRK